MKKEHRNEAALKKESHRSSSSSREKILTCAKTFLSVTMVLQVPQDGKNFSGHMFIGLIVELPAKATEVLTKRDSPGES